MPVTPYSGPPAAVTWRTRIAAHDRTALNVQAGLLVGFAEDGEPVVLRLAEHGIDARAMTPSQDFAFWGAEGDEGPHQLNLEFLDPADVLNALRDALSMAWEDAE